MLAVIPAHHQGGPKTWNKDKNTLHKGVLLGLVIARRKKKGAILSNEEIFFFSWHFLSFFNPP